MDKLAIQVTVALLLVYQARKLHWPWWGILGGLVVSVIVVHLVYDFVYQRITGGTRHLGATAISNDDPLMLAALEEAKRTWPQFLELFQEYPKDSLVKFRLRVKSGEVENVWGDLLALDGETATTYLRTLPVGDAEIPTRRMSVPIGDIIDWQVMVPDSTLRGGFTQQATFRIMERENGTLPRELVEQLGRYRPLSGLAG
jgi:uncharacterized protein YegJ (DUF2314 family)